MSEKVPEVLKDYMFIKDIGEGNFGKVKLSKLIATNEKFAIKILNKEKLKAQTKTSSINEIEILSKLDHPNVIHVENILEDEINFYIIMEYCSDGELFDYIVKSEKLDEIEAAVEYIRSGSKCPWGFFFDVLNKTLRISLTILLNKSGDILEESLQAGGVRKKVLYPYPFQFPGLGITPVPETREIVVHGVHEADLALLYKLHDGYCGAKALGEGG